MITSRPERVFCLIVESDAPSYFYTVPAGCTLVIEDINVAALEGSLGTGTDLIYFIGGGVYILGVYAFSMDLVNQYVETRKIILKAGEQLEIANSNGYSVFHVLVSGTLYGYDWPSE